VSGGEPAAVDGQLSIMAGGSDAAVKRAEPIFAELGKATTHIGPPGAGQVAKAANQVVVALTIQAVAEALTLADRAAQVAELLNALIARGSGGRDHSALVTLCRELSGGYPDNSPSAAASA
jgi:2-hydroxy-3-oxopropionate reductase